MKIRQAKVEDLGEVANIHIQCFPESFSTHLGKHKNGLLQQKFYQEYYNDAPELFLVAEDDTLPENSIVGFCMGYYLNQNDQMKRYLKKNFFSIVLRTAWLLLIGNKAAWAKVKARLFRPKNFSQINNISISDQETGDLLSICVLPNYRGSGAAQQLIERYQQILIENKKKNCLLTVSVDNARGVRFYERNGFVLYRKLVGEAQTYIKVLKQ